PARVSAQGRAGRRGRARPQPSLAQRSTARHRTCDGMSFSLRESLRGRRAAAPVDEPSTTVVTLPRKTRRRDAEQRVAAREQQRRSQRQAELDASRPHGWGRADDDVVHRREVGFLERRRADGTPLLLFTVLAVLTGVGLARVDSRIEVLDIANEITELS